MSKFQTTEHRTPEQVSADEQLSAAMRDLHQAVRRLLDAWFPVGQQVAAADVADWRQFYHYDRELLEILLRLLPTVSPANVDEGTALYLNQYRTQGAGVSGE